MGTDTVPWGQGGVSSPGWWGIRGASRWAVASRCPAPAPLHTQTRAERGHTVRLVVGSGLRPDTWKWFVRRFGPLQVLEMYGLTEGSVATFNYPGQLGAVGRASWLYKVKGGAAGDPAGRRGVSHRGDRARVSLPPACLPLLFDSLRCRHRGAVSGPPRALCGHSSRCLPGWGREADRGGWHWRVGPPGQATPDPVTLPGEPGLLVAPVSQEAPFLGYAGGPELARGKLLADVFRPGDVFFNTGDLLVCDAQGFLRFHDRTGDTFRYRPPKFPIPAWTSALCDSRRLNLSSRTSGPDPAHLPSCLGLNTASA